MYRVIFHDNGSEHVLEREPLEGIEKWAAGQNVTVHEYPFSRTVYSRLPRKVAAPGQAGSPVSQS
jgi:hypothetical protein